MPDTLDLAERARLAVHGLTFFLDAENDYAPWGHYRVDHAAPAGSAAGVVRPTLVAVASYSVGSNPHPPNHPNRLGRSPSAPSPVPTAKHRWSVFPTSSVRVGTLS